MTNRRFAIGSFVRTSALAGALAAAAACGNGTAGAFAAKLLSALGAEVIPLDCELDFTFPRYNPNPEDMRMLHAMAAAVTESKADVALGFDGDGDRCGVVEATVCPAGMVTVDGEMLTFEGSLLDKVTVTAETAGFATETGNAVVWPRGTLALDGMMTAPALSTVTFASA